MKENAFDLTGKVAVVTGAASGLGERIAQTLAAAGAAVLVADINESGAEEVAEKINDSGASAFALRMDVADLDSVKRAVQQILSTHSRIDIGVNAAGVSGGRPEDETQIAIWHHIINVNLTGTYYCCLEYANIMKEQQYGKIINLASMSGTVVNNFPQPPIDESRLLGLPAYCATKAGVAQLTKVFAAQWAKSGIRVNSISPGYMRTAMTDEIFDMPEVINSIERQTPLGRVGRPEDLDGLILYLASDTSDFMTGTEIMIDGGYTIW